MTRRVPYAASEWLLTLAIHAKYARLASSGRAMRVAARCGSTTRRCQVGSWPATSIPARIGKATCVTSMASGVGQMRRTWVASSCRSRSRIDAGDETDRIHRMQKNLVNPVNPVKKLFHLRNSVPTTRSRTRPTATKALGTRENPGGGGSGRVSSAPTNVPVKSPPTCAALSMPLLVKPNSRL
jgi:hypothetical protein